ncbi:DNA gyrase inhibitor YacG [Ferrimonas balearica]|uniref:DNA gyrase inhibitor YacG n=1 Tax=Ferrimonas balearica TaxID=44012 RepID=UPI001C990978|nr:DNA gyrase inhibitor YacG [Ferrimonas balearica]MBY5923188.1 DNA gyrase inhibitor YacG [Ferrimonas balearica]MBY5997436.1 DNA gyrase inhibitor YacG [Ferrimonas balearica]
MTLKVECPTCQAEVTWDDQHPFRPFCSERCKLIDLGEWAEERHAIPGKTELPDEFDISEPDFFLQEEEDDNERDA